MTLFKFSKSIDVCLFQINENLTQELETQFH